LGFSDPCLPPSRSHVSDSSSHELPASYRDPLGRYPFPSTTAGCDVQSWVPPMRSSAPSACKHGKSAIVPVPPETPSLLGLSQTLEGLILTEPRGLVPCHKRSWGSRSSGLFPTADLLRIRHPKTPSRRFPGHSEELPTAPPGVYILRQSVASSGVLHPPSTRCPLELSDRLCGIWQLILGPASSRSPSRLQAHPLMAFRRSRSRSSSS
jgi:hypothetical protein